MRRYVNNLKSEKGRYIPLTKIFFQCDTLTLAEKLLGVCLVHRLKEGRLIGRIVETEAYLQKDPASHSFNGKSNRNAPMFGPPGRAYIYFTYGMHYCFNIVGGEKGRGEAVLIRALEPLQGEARMRKHRAQSSSKKTFQLKELCNGPAKLVQAMGISADRNNTSLLSGSLRLMSLPRASSEAVVRARRIGISKGQKHPYRFYLKDNPFVSKK